jgi:hypothetical protein
MRRLFPSVVLAGLLLPAAAPALRAQAAPPPVTVLFPNAAVARGTV